MPQPQILLGSFTSDGNPRNIEVPIAQVGANIRVELFNRTNFASSANPGVIKRSWWQAGMPAGSYRAVQNTDGAATDESTGAAANGFTLIDTNQTNQLEGPQVGTALTAANPAVATSNAHGYSVGDIVRVTNTTAMLQIAGLDFEITAVGGANNYTLGYLDASGFAAAATAITARRLRYEDIFAPRKRFITNISQAASAVVTFSVSHGYSVGEKIRFSVTSDNGMDEIDGLTGEITAVNTTTNTATVDIDSSGFTAFSFPTSANAALGYSPAHAVPAGEDSSIVSVPSQNTGFAAVHLGSAVVGASSDVIDYRIELGY
ncbi:MAG: hypothetical protein PVI43_00895 [Candidatus Bathyarchaeota archaeon]|jgi:hypothetical protein